MSFERDGIKQITVEELKEVLQINDRDTIVIDVREPDEYEEAHIPGVPSLPMHQVPAMLEGFDKNKEYVFVCRSGNRSQNVSLFMNENGFEKITNYSGGMLSWDGEIISGTEKQIQTVEELKSLKNK